jgi:hypothetical protein
MGAGIIMVRHQECSIGVFQCDPKGMAMMQSQRDSAFFLKWFDRKECLF